jgi:hypothetical protein
VSAGGSLIFDPANNSTSWTFGTASGNGSWLICNGTSGSHAVVKTDFTRASGSGLGGIVSGAGSNGGLVTATYADFTDLGTTTTVGVQTNVYASNIGYSNSDASITNCTFTRCSYTFAGIGYTDTWDGSLTFQYCKFFSSKTLTLGGIGGACASFAFIVAPTSGTRLIDSCSFDAMVPHGALIDCTISNCSFAGGVSFGSGSTWSSDSFFNTNLVIQGTSGSGTSIFGGIENCYVAANPADNPHFLISAVTATLLNCIFEDYGGPPATTPGKALLTSAPSGAITITLQNCITLPVYPSGGGAGIEILNLFGASTDPNNYTTINVLHCTVCDSLGGHYGENGNTGAGQIALYKANFFWNSGSINSVSYKLMDSGHPATGGTSNVVSPTNADYNGSYNLHTGASTFSGNTYTYAGNGYQANFTATPGAHDLTDQNPNFVDITRNLAAWGGTAAGGSTATVAGALATIAANPALIGQATTGLLAWVRAGFRPTNSALQAASYPSDPSTTDAAGNSWPGGSPGIGAMAYLASGASFTALGSSVCRPKQRPALSGPQITELYG